MLRIAVLEKEKVAKDIIFELGKVLEDQTWTFSYFTKISKFAREDEKKAFDVVFFHEMFENPRVSTSFVEHAPKRIVIYCKDGIKASLQEASMFSRILYMDRRNVKSELERLHVHLQTLLRAHDEYLLSYNNVHIALQMHDIYYIEKHDKSLIYHTVRGEFRERKTMAAAETYFKDYDFIRIHASFMVNVRYISKIQNDELVLINQTTLAIARSRKKAVIDWFHEVVKK